MKIPQFRGCFHARNKSRPAVGSVAMHATSTERRDELHDITALCAVCMARVVQLVTQIELEDLDA